MNNDLVAKLVAIQDAKLGRLQALITYKETFPNSNLEWKDIAQYMFPFFPNIAKMGLPLFYKFPILYTIEEYLNNPNSDRVQLKRSSSVEAYDFEMLEPTFRGAVDATDKLMKIKKDTDKWDPWKHWISWIYVAHIFEARFWAYLHGYEYEIISSTRYKDKNGKIFFLKKEAFAEFNNDDFPWEYKKLLIGDDRSRFYLCKSILRRISGIREEDVRIILEIFEISLPNLTQYVDCRVCGNVSSLLQVCGQCNISTYCTEKCQQIDWNTHKQECFY